MPDDVQVVPDPRLLIEDIEYQRPGGKPLLARLYRPKGEGPFPAIVDVHGGAWTKGDRLNNAAMMQVVSARGVVVLSIDFRMPPEAGYPTSLSDINFAIRWFKSRCAGYGVAPDKVGGLGTSSGGHQIFLAAMRPKDPRYAAIQAPGVSADARLAYVIAGWPVIDPYARYRMAQEANRENLIASHHAFWSDVAAMEEGNPQMLLERGEKAELPPGLIVQGTSDDNVDWRWIDKFGETYRKHGGTIEVHKYEGEGHSFIKEDISAPAAVDAINRISAFIKARG